MPKISSKKWGVEKDSIYNADKAVIYFLRKKCLTHKTHKCPLPEEASNISYSYSLSSGWYAKHQHMMQFAGLLNFTFHLFSVLSKQFPPCSCFLESPTKGWLISCRWSSSSPMQKLSLLPLNKGSRISGSFELKGCFQGWTCLSQELLFINLYSGKE